MLHFPAGCCSREFPNTGGEDSDAASVACHADALSRMAVEIDRDRVAGADQDADAFTRLRLVAA
jgi:hypothetical protein